MRNFFLLILIPAMLLAVDFSDDFESYALGDDISSTGLWMGLGGNLVVSADGSNQIAETQWDGNDNIIYLSSGSFSDGSVTSEVKFSGSSAGFGFVCRGDMVEGAYVGGIVSVMPPVCATIIAYQDALTEEQIVLAQDYIVLNEDTWHTLSFEVTGTNPVQLTFSVNGSVNSSCEDVVYLLDSGFTGVATGFDSSEPMFYFDDYVVDDYSVSLARITFGGIKACFR